jgi:hypothetical protein
MNLNDKTFEEPANRRIAVLISAWLGATVILTLLGFADAELVCDDAYYYYEIARNAALGQGFTFDSLHPTNGFHPLWAWILVPVFYLLPHSIWAPIYISLILSAVFTAATALCIHVFFARRDCHEAGLIGAAIWLLNPFTLVLSFRGLEGPLNTFLIAAVFLHLDTVRRRATYTAAEAVRLGALMGLCLLSRTDNVLLLATLSIVLSIELFKRRAWRDLPLKGALFLSTAAAITLPWCVWNLATFGTVVQTSFRSKQMFNLYGQLPTWLPADFSVPADVIQAVVNAFRNLGLVAEYNAKYIMGEEWAPIHDGYLLLYPLLFIGVGLAVLPRAHDRLKVLFQEYGGTAVALGPVGLFCLVHFGWYALVGRNYYNWYFLPPVFAFSLFAGQRLGFLKTLPARAARVAVAGMLAGLVLTTPIIISKHVSVPERYSDEIQFLVRTRPRIEPLPSGAKLGAWNAGATGYFASFHYPDRYVVNLDGLVNNDVPRYVLESSYEQYLLENIDFLIESPGPMTWVVGVPRTRAFVSRHLGPRLRVTTSGPVVRATNPVAE